MALLRYTLLRLLILAVVGVLLWLFGLRGFVLLFAAVLTSGVVSIFVLRGSRDQVSRALDWRLSTINQRLQRRVVAEDAWNDAEREAEHNLVREDGRDLEREGESDLGPEGEHAPERGGERNAGQRRDPEHQKEG